MLRISEKLKRIILLSGCAMLFAAFASCGAASAQKAENIQKTTEEQLQVESTPSPHLPDNIKLHGENSSCAEISGIMSPGDMKNLLDGLALFQGINIRSFSFSASAPSAEDLRMLSEAYPDAEICWMYDLSGVKFNLADSTLEIANLSHENVRELASILPAMNNLEEIDLGEETPERNMTWEDIALLENAAPNAAFRYAFSLYGKNFQLTDTKMSLHHIPINDEGELVRKVISCMPALSCLDMDSTGVSDESMEKIRKDFPDIKVVWRIWFGENYSVRTDVKKILASNPGNGGNLTVDNTKSLKYCTEVKYLDIGHNEILHDISFIKYMPDLEVAILAMDYFSDTSPLACCPHLEFLEIQTNEITDLTPLSGLKELKHLNIGHNYNLCDISPLYGLTQLERLWIGSIDPVPDEQVQEMQRHAPDCVINTEVWDPHAGNWRYDASRESGFSERYELLVEQFGYDKLDYSYYWMDPYYYEDGRIPWVYMDSVYGD